MVCFFSQNVANRVGTALQYSVRTAHNIDLCGSRSYIHTHLRLLDQKVNSTLLYSDTTLKGMRQNTSCLKADFSKLVMLAPYCVRVKIELGVCSVWVWAYWRSFVYLQFDNCYLYFISCHPTICGGK